MYVSFMCNLSLLILHIWYFSNVFKCFPFFPVNVTSILCVVVSYVWTVFSILFEYPELPLLLLIACVYLLYLVWNILFVLYISRGNLGNLFSTSTCKFFLYLSVCEFGFIIFCIVFRFLNAIFIGVSLKSFKVLRVFSFGVMDRCFCFVRVWWCVSWFRLCCVYCCEVCFMTCSKVRNFKRISFQILTLLHGGR
jgi:hypothetical protein